MLDDPIQLLIVAAIVIVFFVMGPKKIPELARAIGQARGEFSAASALKPSGLLSTLASAPATGNAAAPPVGTGASHLIETAEKLGIPTEGKTPAEISDAIVAKVNSKQ